MKISPKEFISTLQPINDLAERNKAFKALSAEQKRREIAFDCLNLTLAGKVRSAKGIYWGGGLDIIISQSIKNAKEFQEKLVNDLPDDCEVCARGGLMLAQIRLGNSISPKVEELTCGRTGIIRGFNIDSFICMEDEYEYSWYNQPYVTKSTEKLQNICLNVIANGNFNTNDKTDYLVDYLKK